MNAMDIMYRYGYVDFNLFVFDIAIGKLNVSKEELAFLKELVDKEE